MSPSHRVRIWMDLGLAVCGFAAWLALAGCEGSATQTTTGKAIEGVLVDDQGNPESGATVKAWLAGYGPIRGGMAQDSGQAASTRTDERGHYAISDLEVGVYNLFGIDSAKHATVLIPRVKYLEQAADLGTDTLKAPGAVRGQVRVDGGKAPLTFCYLEGSDYAAISDSAGRFLLPDLAEGRYRLNYFANGYASAVDSVVTVHSGDTTVLSAKTLTPDLALQPPAPAGVSAVYDSVYGVVRLAWSPVRAADLKEYQIEIEDIPNDVSLPHSWTLKDTAYDDRMMIQMATRSGTVWPITRKYWVRSRDIEGNMSPKQAQPVSVRLTRPTIFQTEFTMHPIPDSAAQNECLDTVAFALDVASSPDSLVRIQWQAKSYYHNSASAKGEDRIGSKPSLGVSVGAPHRDTLFLTHQTLDGLGASGSQIVWDSLFVSAYLSGVRSVMIPVRLDSLGCFHPSPAIK